VYLWKSSRKTIKGIVQIVHGASEYCHRYDHFAEFLNKNGYHVIGNDHLGHGKTAGKEVDAIYFDESIGFHKVYEGVKRVRDYITEEFDGLPVIMFAHSMGSFIGRYAIIHDYKRYDMALFSGTGYFNPVTTFFGTVIANLIVRFKGEKYVSEWFNNNIMDRHIKRLMRTGLIHKRIEWISQDRKIQSAFLEDEYCGKPFTIGAQRDILKFIPEIQNKKLIKESASSTAIYFMCGDMDPLGKFGEAVKGLYEVYLNCGYSNVKFTILNNTRHEIINSTERDNHYQSIVRWLDRNLA
jgi:alpha-beta hydrolase superfamily lysophospholipase